jgi:hypothetical protein
MSKPLVHMGLGIFLYLNERLETSPFRFVHANKWESD